MNALDELAERRQWVAWKFEDRDGKPTKVPYRADGRHRASATDATTWCSKDEARAAALDGIGFVVSEGDPYCGVDLDHCLEDGALKPWAAAIVEKLDSYTEVTPSGAGVRVWIKASLPGTRSRKGPIEIYDHGRFFTVTGQHLAGTPPEINERQAELDDVYRELFGVENQASPDLPRQTPPHSLTDARVLDLARQARNGAKVERLLRGDASGYASESEADQALVSSLAFYTQDPGQLERLWLGSGLNRQKLERDDYRRRTVEKALEGRTEVYEAPGEIVSGRQRQTASLGTAAEEDAPAESALSSWRPVDLSAVLAGDLTPNEPAILTREDGRKLLYPRRINAFWGEPESGKSMAAKRAVAEQLLAGQAAAVIDFENEAADTVGHLLAMGVPDAAIRERLTYWRPDEAFGDEARVIVLAELARRRPVLVVIDGVNSSLAKMGCDPNSNPDVLRWHDQFLRPVLLASGGTLLTIDHVTKNKETRGDWASGSEAKKSIISGAAFAFEVAQPFGRGRTGVARLLLHKDRPGALRAHVGNGKEIARLRLESTEDGSIRASIDLPAGAEGESDDTRRWRPTALMERVSKFLEGQEEPTSKAVIEQVVAGRREYVRQALAALIEDGFVVVEAGSRGSLLHRVRQPFRESSATSPDLAPTSPNGTGASFGRTSPVPGPPSLEGARRGEVAEAPLGEFLEVVTSPTEIVSSLTDEDYPADLEEALA